MMFNNANLRILNIDVHSEINPTSVVLYQDNLDSYTFLLRLIDGDTFYIIPDSTKVTLKLNGVEIPSLNYQVTDKYRGTIKLKICSDYFKANDTFINTALAHMLTIEMYSESTFGLHQYIITVPITVTTGSDSGDSDDNGTTVEPPTMPNPAWNLTQGDASKPDNPNIPDLDLDSDLDGVHVIFDGGEFF